jgi:hypothetical protein
VQSTAIQNKKARQRLPRHDAVTSSGARCNDAVAFPARLLGRSSPASSLPMSNADTLSDQGSGMRIF